ncbi:Aminopeptidase N [Camponotus floridanus]|uniref:Aminopeptidase N n=1 Tax=Camponotus floridanus TaxID=104421 RepID=E2ATV1_CAMFO|nr:Aminopeptidase N [Camponotus floridanus]
MPIREQSDDSNRDGIIWTHFDKTPIMSPYLVAFVVTDYVRVPTEDETINIWCRSILVPHIKFVQEIVQKSKKLLTEYTNSTSKVPKIDIVAHSFPIISTNWGLTIIGEIFLTYNESFDTIFDKLHVAQTTVHEMANLWLGNVVTPLWWIFKEWRIMEYFVIDIQQTMLQDINMNLSPITLKINNPIGPEKILLNFIASIHNKAPAIVRMLQHIITDEVFRNGLIKYLHTHQFSSATSDDLWNALQAVLDKSDVPHNAYRLKEVMDTWIKQSDLISL